MPKSALPDNFELGPDNRSWIMRMKKIVQIWLAGGPRIKKGMFSFRDIPKTLYISHSGGELRYENTDGSSIITGSFYKQLSPSYKKMYYPSRIQPWCKQGRFILWPFFFNFWYFRKKEDMVIPPKYQSDFGIKKLFTVSGGYKRDADKVYWLTWYGPAGNFE